jgi:hypothetical protein
LSGIKRKHQFSELTTAIAAAAIVCLLLIGVPVHNRTIGMASLTTMLIVFNFVAGIACLFSWGYLRRRRAWIFAMVWVLLTCLVPVIVDAVYAGMTGSNTEATVLTAISPPGAVALICSNSSISIFPGIIGQLLLTIIPVGLLLLARARAKKTANLTT